MKKFIVDVVWLSLQYFLTVLAVVPFAATFAYMKVMGTYTEAWGMLLLGCGMVFMSLGWASFNRVKIGKWKF